MKNIFRSLRRYFFTGIIVLLPLMGTVYILMLMFHFFSRITGNIFKSYLHVNIPGVGFLTTVIIIILVGLFATNVIGKRLIALAEKLILSIPVIKSLYGTFKQITDTFLQKNNQSFKRVVMVEYPRKGLYTVGFVTNDGVGEVQEKTVENVINVFFPTTPNPTSGWLALVPKEDIINLDMSVEEGVKLIISGGIITPASTKKQD